MNSLISADDSGGGTIAHYEALKTLIDSFFKPSLGTVPSYSRDLDSFTVFKSFDLEISCYVYTSNCTPRSPARQVHLTIESRGLDDPLIYIAYHPTRFLQHLIPPSQQKSCIGIVSDG